MFATFERFKSEVTKYNFINSKFPEISLQGNKISEFYPTITKVWNVTDQRDVEYILH